MKQVKATVILSMTDQQAAVWNALFPEPTPTAKPKRKPKAKHVKQPKASAWSPARLKKFRATMKAKQATNGQVPEPVLAEA